MMPSPGVVRLERRLRLWTSASVLAAIAISTSCGSNPVPSPTATRSGPVSPRPLTPVPTVHVAEWVLDEATVRGEALPLRPDYPITLVVGTKRLSGVAPCNSYFAEITRSGNEIVVTDISVSVVGCGEEVAALERAFLQILPTVNRIEDSQPNELILSGPETILKFVPSPHDLPLRTTTWTLIGVEHRGIAVTPDHIADALLAFRSDHDLLGSTGCRTLYSKYTTHGNRITAARLEAYGSCSPALTAQDDHIIRVLGDGFYADFHGNELVLTSGTTTLTYGLVDLS